jgi:hypothetical protein
MRPRNQVARDLLLPTLRKMPRASVAQLASALGIAPPTLHKLLRECPAGLVVSGGRSMRTGYALRRPLRGNLTDIPLYAISRAGDAALLANLALVYPQGTLLRLGQSEWPVPSVARDGWWDGLPYPLYDIRPQGYLGRIFARTEHETLGVPANPEEWTDDDIVFALSQAGADASGNLILGDVAYARWLRNKIAPSEPVADTEIGPHYAQLAQSTLATGIAGSSAAGEFPKFTTLRREGQTTPHVLVKFSGAGESAAERRWADLLVCEHLALECAARMPNVSSARTRIVQHAGRVFLEAERFDRAGLFGRLPICTLDVIAATFLGSTVSEWPALAALLLREKLIEPETVRRVELLWWFGRLIANSDMHLANLSFHVSPTLGLTPAYDMLPMLYAPERGGEVPPQNFNPALPSLAQTDVWRIAATYAIEFWQQASADARISESFRAACTTNAQRVRSLTERV